MSAANIPTAREAIAVQLHYQGCKPEQIQVNTRLGREQILIAIDRAETERFRHPNTPPPPPPPRKRASCTGAGAPQDPGER